MLRADYKQTRTLRSESHPEARLRTQSCALVFLDEMTLSMYPSMDRVIIVLYK